MNYYKEKRKAFHLIDKLDSEGKSTAAIVFRVETLFGFGEQFVKKRLKLREHLSDEELRILRIEDKPEEKQDEEDDEDD